MTKRKLTILGAGPGGYTAAIRAAENGWDVTIIERAGLGGVCLHHGCIPVKALLASARAFTSAEKAASYGVMCEDVSFDYSKFMTRKDDIVAVNARGIEGLLKGHEIRILAGTGMVVSPSQVTCVKSDGDVVVIDSNALFIATGSSPAIPGHISVDNRHIFDSNGQLEVKKLPESCVILGGGVIGCEFASLFADLGVRVTIVEQQPSLLPLWDSDLSASLARSFKRRKIIVRTGATVESATVNERTDSTIVRLADGTEIDADRCLVAFGRKPNVSGFGLESIGVAYDDAHSGGIRVGETMETSVEGVYAVGDVTGIRMLAHVASAQGITAADALAGKKTPVRYDAVPDCLWANPELASVGMTAEAAVKQGIDTASFTFHYRSLGIAHALGEIDGFVKTVIEKGSERVLGVHISGHGAPELIAEASVIVTEKLTVAAIEETIHAHPTFGEIVKESILGAAGRNIHR